MSDTPQGLIPVVPVKLALSNGAEILVQPAVTAGVVAYGPAPGGGLAAYTPPPVPFLGGEADAQTLPFSSVSSVISGIMEDLGEAVKAAAPDKFTLEVGLEIKAQTGPILSVLLAGGGSASVTVTMEWENDASGPKAGAPATGGAQKA